MGGEDRNKMMQNLFGEQSEEEEEEEGDEVESGYEDSSARRRPHYHSEEGEGELENEGECEVEGLGGAEAESEAEMHDVDPDRVGSEGERPQSSHETEGSDDVAESEEKGPENEEEDYGQRVVTGRRRDVIASESERSDENHYASNEDEEVGQARRSSSPSNKKDHLEHSPSEKPVLRDVLGDSDEDEAGEYGARNELEQDSHMNMIKVSNIMGIEHKPFDPKTCGRGCICDG